ncbi:alpha/beta fold hydrolase [Micromonospora sonneratiae]|uniref:Alpha/beta fold hydrolase n=1 Tax=Micromonospora sonneratiae TaxID=1184706 RepID=A0ABW3Y7M3_9ACTN
MEDDLRVRTDAHGEPTLLLVHGMGATGDVWDGLRELLVDRWPGRWMVPDLPGHGGSEALPEYSFESLATSLAKLVAGAGPVVVLGHSLGGVLGLTLAQQRYGVQVDAVIGLGIKVAWTDDELAKVAALAARPVTFFDTRAAAADRYLRVSGLAGLFEPADDAVSSGLRTVDGQWRLAMDPGVFGVGAPDMPALLAGTRARVVLARGEHDPMVTEDQLRRLSPSVVSLPGLGHNAHVEDPAAVLGLLEDHLPGR